MTGTIEFVVERFNLNHGVRTDFESLLTVTYLYVPAEKTTSTYPGQDHFIEIQSAVNIEYRDAAKNAGLNTDGDELDSLGDDEHERCLEACWDDFYERRREARGMARIVNN